MSIISSLISAAWVKTMGVGVISGGVAWLILDHRTWFNLIEVLAAAVFAALFISPIIIVLFETFVDVELSQSAVYSITSIVAISSHSLIQRLVDEGLIGIIASMKNASKGVVKKEISKKIPVKTKREELLEQAKKLRDNK